MQKEIAKHYVYVLLFYITVVPGVVNGQNTFKSFASEVIRYLNLVAVFIMGLALLLFIVGVIRFIATAGDDQSRAAGKQLMVWGILSLFVMVSVWGIVEIIRVTFFG